MKRWLGMAYCLLGSMLCLFPASFPPILHYLHLMPRTSKMCIVYGAALHKDKDNVWYYFVGVSISTKLSVQGRGERTLKIK